MLSVMILAFVIDFADVRKNNEPKGISELTLIVQHAIVVILLSYTLS